MQKNNIVKNYIYNSFYQILIMVLPLITMPYISRVLGAEAIGMYGYTNSITQYFILFGCIGLNLYGQREIAYHQNDIAERSKAFWELFLIRCVSISLCLIVFVVALCNNSKYGFLFRIQVLDIIAALIDISWFFQGMEDFKKIVIRNSCVKTIGVVLILCLVKDVGDLWIYALIYSATLFFGNITMWLYMPKYLVQINLRICRPLTHLKPALVLFLPQIATSIYTLLDKSMIGLLTGDDVEVAYYEQAQKIVKMVLAVATSLGTVMMPRIANMFSQGKFEEIQKYIFKSLQFVCALSFPLCFGLCIIANDFIPWFLGDGYYGVVNNMILMAPLIPIIGMSNVIGVQYFLPVGKQAEYTKSVVAGTLVNFVLNIILIPLLLSQGAVIASVVAESVVLLTQLLLVKKQIKILEIIKNIYKYIIAAIMMSAVLMLVSFKWIENILMRMGLTVIVGGVVYVVVLIFLKETYVIQYWKKISSKARKDKGNEI